jgi:hypothetical protein
MLLCVILILTFLWRVFTPAHEYQMQSVLLMTMGFDLLCLVCLIWFRITRPNYFPNGLTQALCVVAVFAGIGLFVIRFHNKASWWTGHWTYYLLERK